MESINYHQLYDLIKTDYEKGIEEFKKLKHEEVKENWFYEKLLFYSCEANKKDLLEILINLSNHRMHRQDIKGKNLLIKSVINDSYDCINFLMDLKDFKPKVTDKEGNTFFHYLVQKERHDLYAILFNTSIQMYPEIVNQKNYDGESPLHLACINGADFFVQMLLDNGADVYALTRESLSVLNYALQSEKNTEYIVKLIEAQLKANPKKRKTTKKEGELKSKSLSSSGSGSVKSDSSNSSEESPRSVKSPTEGKEEEFLETTNFTPTANGKEVPERKNSRSFFGGWFEKKQPEKPKAEIYKMLFDSIPPNTVRTIIPPNHDADPENKKFKIVSVDGGGIKCALQIIIFRRLADKFPTLFDDVDLFCGVSASSFIACHLAAGMAPTDIQMLMMEICKYSFEKKSKGITESMYSNKYLINVGDISFGEKKLSDLPKKVLINAFQFDTGAEDPNRTCKACVFNNFIPGYDCKIKDAVLRSCAAVGYFPPYQGYADGGIFENNPSTLAYPFVFGENGLNVPVKNAVCLSLSSGRPPVNYIDSSKYTDVGMFQLLPLVMSGFMWSRKSMADEISKAFLGEKYMRFDPVLPDSIDLDNAQHLGAIIDLANKIDISHIEEWIMKYWF